MLRFRDSKNPSAGYHYFSKSDAGLAVSELRSEVGGKAAELLSLKKEPEFEQFRNLLHGLHPDTGTQLTAKLVDDRISYWDITASVPKGVTIALERGDTRIHDAIWEAGRETMSELEGMIPTRKRKGGAQEDRVTGNLVWFGFEHPETRPAKQDGMPDPDRHIHFVVPNLTYDPVEKEWKAIKFRPVMELRKYFDRGFDARLARKLTDLGYNIEIKHKDGKFHTWDIKDMPKAVTEKFSRRTGEVEALAEKLGITGPRKDKLGATSRQFKRDDMTLADYRAYWDGRVTPDEARAVAEVIQKAIKGENSPQRGNTQEAVAYSLSHNFERQSVIPWQQVAITALERGMGAVRPEHVMPEAKRQGLLVKNGEATTKAVLAEEQKIIAFARDGRGTCRAMGRVAREGGVEPNAASPVPSGTRRAERNVSLPHGADTAIVVSEQQALSDQALGASSPQTPSPMPDGRAGSEGRVPAGSAPQGSNPSVEVGASRRVDVATAPGLSQPKTALSPEQAVMVNHVLTSPDRVMLVIGDAGTGKTFAVKSAFRRIGRPVDIIAPSADASRGVLRKEGFKNADTVTAFLGDRDRQAAIKNGVIWVDEAGMLPVRDLSRLVDVAKEQNARLVLQGDPKQHRSVARDGNMLRVLESHARLPVARLKDIRRQRGQYKQAVADLAEGRIKGGFDALNDLGWVKQTPALEHNQPLVEDYLAALDAKKDVLAVAPTHTEAAEVTAALRDALKARGELGEERTVKTLAPLHWTEAERTDLERYTGNEVLQFHRNGGTFKAGDRIAVADLKKTDRLGKPSTFAVYARGEIALAAGDRIRITANGWDASRKHRLDNGGQYQVAGFEKDGKIRLTNGWFIAPDFKHLTHGYVTTSHAAQGKTVDRVLIAMGHESLPAINREQFYVSVSRGRESATIYTGVSPTVLRDAIVRADARKAAVEVFGKRRREWWLSRRARAMWQALRTRAMTGMPERHKQREYGHER